MRFTRLVCGYVHVVSVATHDALRLDCLSVRLLQMLLKMALLFGVVCYQARIMHPHSILWRTARPQVRTWDVFAGKGGTETLQHSHDVLALAFRCAGCLHLATGAEVFAFDVRTALVP